jgi:hypothetical protein
MCSWECPLWIGKRVVDGEERDVRRSKAVMRMSEGIVRRNERGVRRSECVIRLDDVSFGRTKQASVRENVSFVAPDAA